MFQVLSLEFFRNGSTFLGLPEGQNMVTLYGGTTVNPLFTILHFTQKMSSSCNCSTIRSLLHQGVMLYRYFWVTLASTLNKANPSQASQPSFYTVFFEFRSPEGTTDLKSSSHIIIGQSVLIILVQSGASIFWRCLSHQSFLHTLNM